MAQTIMLDYINYLGYIGHLKISALAVIIYDGTLLNIASERFLKDIGASPRDNATLYSGRAKQFATDMSMPITVVAGQHLYKFDHDTDTFVHYEIPGGMTTYHLGKVDGSGAFENKTYGLVVVFTNELSTADFNLMTEEPEALVNMIANNVVDTRFTVTKDDCEVCIPVTEDGKYVRNCAEDKVKFLNGTVSGCVFGTNIATVESITEDIIHVNVTNGDGSNLYIGWVSQEDFNNSDYYAWDMHLTFENVSNIASFNSLQVGTTSVWQGIPNGTVDIVGIGKITRDVNFPTILRYVVNITGSCDIYITKSLHKITASEINNYATLPAPDIRALNTGLQTTKFKLDNFGMIDGVDEGMEWHGAEKAETPTRTRTANITIEITPNTVESILLVDTTTGDITMNANGTVTASSGSVDIDTTTLQVDVKSIVTVTGISINGVSTLFDDLNGTIHNYTEETL